MNSINPLSEKSADLRPISNKTKSDRELKSLKDDNVSLDSGEADDLPDNSKLKELIRLMPKVDLHRHLEGAIRPETIINIAKKYNISLPSYDIEGLKPYVQVTEKDKSLLDFIKKFDVIGKVFVNIDAIREISEQCVADAKKENIKAMELRFSPLYMASLNGLDLHEVVDAVIDGVKRGEEKYGIKTGLVMICERQMGPDKAKLIEDLAEEYRDISLLPYQADSDKPSVPGLKKGILGIDLANDEFHFPPGPYAEVYREAEREHLHRTVHAGEALGSESVKTAVSDCIAERIGHGVRAKEDPELVKELAEKGITLEMCPTSNVQTQAVTDFSTHPLKEFFDIGLKVTINTDDPAVCDTDLNKEYEWAVTKMGCSIGDIIRMDLNAVNALFLPLHDKKQLRNEFEEEFLRIDNQFKNTD